MPIDPNEEIGDLVRLTVRSHLTTPTKPPDDAAIVKTAYVAKPFRSISIELFTAEAPARTWLCA